MRSSHRSGALLILVAGICSLLAALAVTFLARMRSDMESIALIERETQARIMLLAACDYVLEASRLGYDTSPGPVHEECYGWVDIRDGKLGPKSDPTGADDASRFPLGAHARCPMHVLRMPPYAIQMSVTPNLIDADETAADWGRPYLRHPDPQPVAQSFAAFAQGDPRPRQESVGRSWFRVYREPIVRGVGNGRRFVVTCGAGATMGFRDWDEVVAENQTAAFGGDADLFAQLRATEVRTWYRVEWNAAVAPPQNLLSEMATRDTAFDHCLMYPPNDSDISPFALCHHAFDRSPNPVGSISLVERLRVEPSDW